MSRINAPKGTIDILPADSWKWQAIERIARDVAALYHFDEIRTPIFEHTEVFERGVGETSEVVGKQMYTFSDRGERSRRPYFSKIAIASAKVSSDQPTKPSGTRAPAPAGAARRRVR